MVLFPQIDHGVDSTGPIEVATLDVHEVFAGKLDEVAATMHKYNFPLKYSVDPSRACEIVWYALYWEKLHGPLDAVKGYAWLNRIWQENYGGVQGRVEELAELAELETNSETEENMEVIIYL